MLGYIWQLSVLRYLPYVPDIPYLPSRRALATHPATFPLSPLAPHQAGFVCVY